MRVVFIFLVWQIVSINFLHSQVAYTNNLTVDSPCFSGVKELSNQFELYPNPVENTLSIVMKGTNGSIRLLDVNGKEVLNQNVLIGKMDVDVKNIESGIYIGIITSDDKIYKTKVVIR